MKWNEYEHAYRMTTKSELKNMKWEYTCYCKRNLGTIEQAYKKPSKNKVSAFYSIAENANDLFSYVSSCYVISKNCNKFTMGFLFESNETGELCFMYVTDTYNRYCTVQELEDMK